MMAKPKRKSNGQQKHKTLSPIRPKSVSKSTKAGNQTQLRSGSLKFNQSLIFQSNSEDLDFLLYKHPTYINSDDNYVKNAAPSEATDDILPLSSQKISNNQIELSKQNSQDLKLEAGLGSSVKTVELNLFNAEKDNYKLRQKIQNLEMKYQQRQEYIDLGMQKLRELKEVHNFHQKLAQNSEIDSAPNELSQKSEELLMELQQLSNQNAGLISSYESFVDDNPIYQELRIKNLELLGELNHLKKDNAELKIHLKAKGINNDRLMTGLKMLKEKYDSLRKEKLPILKDQPHQLNDPEIITQFANETDKLKSQINEREKEKTLLMTKLAESQSQNSKLRNKSKKIEEKYASLNEKSKEYTKTINDLRNKVKKLININQTLLSSIADVTQSTETFSSIVYELNALQQAEEQYTNSCSCHNDAEFSASQYEQIIEAKEKKIEKLNNQLKKEQNEKKKLNQKISELNSKMTQLCDTVTLLERNQSDFDKLQQQNAEIKKTNIQLTKEVHELNEIKDNYIFAQLEQSKLFNSLYDINSLIGKKNQKIEIRNIEDSILIIDELKNSYKARLSELSQLMQSFDQYKEGIKQRQASAHSSDSFVQNTIEQLREENKYNKLKLKKIENENLALREKYETLKLALDSNQNKSPPRFNQPIEKNSILIEDLPT